MLGIEGLPVNVVGFEISDEKQGRRGKYKLTKVTLDDERTFTVAGSGVAGVFEYIEDEDLPVEVIFRRVESDFEAGSYYWRAE